jgi:hypothetical protein
MAKQVIVVVHGVGVKQAGVSSDLLAAALQNDNGDGTNLPPHSSDDFLLLENRAYDTSGKASTFPARVRRYRSYENDKDKALIVKQERVIADFFWGDVTAFGSGVVNVVLAYFKVAMGLSHAIRENASDVYRGSNREDRWIRRLARGAALTIHGPVIALNIVLLVGLLIATLIRTMAVAGCDIAPKICPHDGALLPTQVLLVGLAAIVIGMLILRGGRGAFLYRHLVGWVVLSGVAFLILGSPEWLPAWLALPSKAVAYIESHATRLADISPDEFNSTYTGLIRAGWRLLALMYIAWLVVVVQVLLVCILSIVRRIRVGKSCAPNLIIPSLGLMSLLWLFLIAALWAAVLKFHDSINLDLKPDVVAGALTAIGAAVVMLPLLGLAAAGVLSRKRELKRKEFASPSVYMDRGGANADGYANRYRLLIASRMLLALNFFLPLVVLTIYYASNDKAVAHWTLTIIFGILAVGTALVYTLNAEFAAGLGILADVLAYLNNGSWISGATTDPYKAKPRKTFLQRWFFKNKPEADTRTHGYWLRRRIHDRLDVLIQNLLRDEKPDRLDIVSHSQGTMIAIDLLAIRGEDWLKGLPNDCRGIGLVTMGSPYTHLYNHYFPSSFRPIGDCAKLQPGGGVLREWLNIFRIDDFVGTHIGKGVVGVWPEEYPVPPNGHTNYWVDRGVVARLRQFLKTS